MDGITLIGVQEDPETGISSVVYFSDRDGALRLFDTGGVWTATTEDGYSLPGIFATADEALESANGYLDFQYDD